MDTPDYSFGSRLLHHLALGLPWIGEMSFELDGLFPGKKQTHPDERHVFVSGLARAGTTMILRTFHETGQFRSLTYRDMPFVLMPNLWGKFSKHFKKQMHYKERAHGDGILVNFDSPEAFEEVFWRVFSGDEYLRGNFLEPYPVSEELIQQFRMYVRRILNSANVPDQRRYLSKNNNNILRLNALQKAFPQSLILIPFREPLQQALSLSNQHKKFCAYQTADPFLSDFMRWLGHHEFGHTHKPFCFKKKAEDLPIHYEPSNVNHWLKIWIEVHRFLLHNAPAGSSFICFENLCASPVEVLRNLFESIDLPLNERKVTQSFQIPRPQIINEWDEDLKIQAQAIYQDLRKDCRYSNP